MLAHDTVNTKQQPAPADSTLQTCDMINNNKYFNKNKYFTNHCLL